MIIKIINSIRKRGFLGVLRLVYIDFMAFCEKKLKYIRDHKTNYQFIDRSRKHKTLVIVLAGYKSYLWPATLDRLYKYTPKDVDVCVASSGIYSFELEKICEKNNWSYLSTKRNAPGVAINKTLDVHPNAEFVFKLDEDIFIGKNFFQLLIEGYKYAWEDSSLEPGFCAPVLNINGVSYINFVQKLGIEQLYKDNYGPLVKRCDKIPIHNNPETARWIWRNSLPFDEVLARFSSNKVSYSICPTRFSIGAILFKRDFINNVGGFKSAWYSGCLGEDEDGICRDCMSLSRPIVIIENVMAGHFSFYPQEKVMRLFLSEMSDIDPVTFPEESYARQSKN